MKEHTFTEERAKFYVAQLVIALQYLHAMNVIYRDVKLENVLICEDGYIKLTDFGLSKENVSDGDRSSTFCGTPEYLSPEVVLGEDYTNAIDFWGVGVMTFEMIHGEPPFESDNIQQLYHKILYNPLVFPVTSTASPVCKDFINQMLQKKVEERLNTAEKIKNHPWLKEYDFDGLFQKRLPAPWKPTLEENGCNNFDDTFTSEKVDIKQDYEESRMDDSKQQVFGDFTYIKKDQ